MLVKIFKGETKNEKYKCRVNRRTWEVKSDITKGKVKRRKLHAITNAKSGKGKLIEKRKVKTQVERKRCFSNVQCTKCCPSILKIGLQATNNTQTCILK